MTDDHDAERFYVQCGWKLFLYLGVQPKGIFESFDTSPAAASVKKENAKWLRRSTVACLRVEKTRRLLHCSRRGYDLKWSTELNRFTLSVI